MCVVTPVMLLLCILSVAIHVRIGLGRFPKPMVDKYSNAALDFHVRAVHCFGMFTMFAAIPLWLLLLCFRTHRISWEIHLLQAAIYLTGWGLVVGYLYWDPYRFVEWFLD
jgi:hypothetical protein